MVIFINNGQGLPSKWDLARYCYLTNKNYFLMAAMPGSSLPSRASSMAPPPVLT